MKDLFYFVIFVALLTAVYNGPDETARQIGSAYRTFVAAAEGR